MNRITRLLASITALALVASACGGSDDAAAEAAPSKSSSLTFACDRASERAGPHQKAARRADPLNLERRHLPPLHQTQIEVN